MTTSIGNRKVIESEDEMDESMLEDLQKEYMALAEKGDRAAFDFALEFSDAVNVKAQDILMAMMSIRRRTSPEIALWTLMSCQDLLGTIEKEAASQWSQTEYARRHQENLEMQDSWLDCHTDDYRDLV